MNSCPWPPEFDVSRCQDLCRHLGVESAGLIRHSRLTSSTNDDALALARDGAPNGAVVVADEQRAGRGRRGGHWVSPAREGLLFSLIVRLGLPLEQIARLPLVIGLGVREVVARELSQPVLVKWPNDILVDGKKLAGILVESLSRGALAEAAIVGVGLNVFSPEFPHDLRDSATSLFCLGARSVTRESLLAELLAAFQRRTRQLARDGFRTQWLELNRVDALAGKLVRVGNSVGIARGIADNGGLRLESKEGNSVVLAGSVEILGG